MRIRQIDLKNVKSYRQASVAFTEGTNAICGPNGAGKSTLLETIGFVLFDSLPYVQRNFVREGEKTATATVHLEIDDGRVYRVIRKCGGSSQYEVHDPELGKLTSGKEETLAWLRQYMKVEDAGDLPALFEDAVGVPQGLLTAAFLDKASNRKNTFNPLLRVDEYERAWDVLRGPRRRLKEWIAEREKSMARFEAEAKALPQLREKVARLRTEIEAGEKRQRALSAELEQVSQRKRALESVKERMDGLERTVAQAGMEVKTLDTRLEQAQAAVERAAQAHLIAGETESGHRAYLAAQENLKVLEKQRKERDRLNKALQKHATSLALAQQQVGDLTSRLAAIAAAEAEMEALRPQVESQERLEGTLAKARRTADQLAGAQRNQRQEQTRLAEMEAKLKGIRSGLAELAEVEGQTVALQAELDELDGRRDALTARIATHRAELAQLEEQTAALQVIEADDGRPAAQCPVCEGPLTPQHRAELLARNQARQAELGAGLVEAQSQQTAATKTRGQKQRALRKLEKRAKQLPRPAEADDLAAQIDVQRQVLAGIEETVDELSGTPAEVERIESELQALGDPRRDHQRAADRAGQREAVERDLAATGKRIAELEGQIDVLRQELAGYADLDQRVETERATRTAHETEHQRYLEHIREAGTLEERQGSVTRLRDERESARTEHERLAQERDRVAADYDAQAYAKVLDTHATLSRDTAVLKERIRGQRVQVNEEQVEIERLVGVQEALDATRAEHAELGEVLALLEHLRQVLRDAGPKVTQALVEVISVQAARLYADIMTDHTARLRWTEDYDITLAARGQERAFKQLSGGEQMAAALSVRLALLREVSGIDVAFFDEPTANLDERRRDNLAEQILNVKGFSQLFVISHDDTFERNTDNVVRVVKRNGVSWVEA